MAYLGHASDQRFKLSYFHVDTAWKTMPSLHGSPCRGCMEESVPGGCQGREGGPGMLRTISGDNERQRAAARRRFPTRRLHLVDIENLAGDSLPSLSQVREAQGLY